MQRMALAHLDKLPALGRQRPETPKRLARQASSGFRADRHEPGDQFGVDPVRLGQSAPALPERLDLRRRELARVDPSRLQALPKPPFVAARGFEANQSGPVPGHALQLRVAGLRVRQAKLAAVAQAMNVEPIARDVQADDLQVWQSAHALFLLVRGPSRPHATVRDAEERRCGSLRRVVLPQGPQRHHRPVAGPREGRRREQNISAEIQKVPMR